MNRHEMTTISATFARSIWTNPRNGECRMYVNNLNSCEAKVWIKKDNEAALGWSVNFNLNGSFGWTAETAYAAVDNALENAGVAHNASWSEILTAASRPASKVMESQPTAEEMAEIMAQVMADAAAIEI